MKSETLTGIILGLIAVVGWSSYSVAARIGIDQGFTPMELGVLRYLVPGFIFLPILPFGFFKKIFSIGLKKLVILTLLAGPIYGVAVMQGLEFAPISHAVVLGPGFVFATTLVLNYNINSISPSPTQLFGGVLMFSGISLLAGNSAAPSAPSLVPIGDFLFIVSGVGMGIFTFLLKRWSIHPIYGYAGTALISLIVLLPLVPLIYSSSQFKWDSSEYLFQAAMQGVVGGFMAMVAFTSCVSRIGAVRASYFPGLVPLVTAVVLASLSLEPITKGTVLGILLVSFGLIAGQLQFVKIVITIEQLKARLIK